MTDITDVISFLADNSQLEYTRKLLRISDVYSFTDFKVNLVGNTSDEIIIYYTGYPRSRLLNILEYQYPDDKFEVFVYAGHLPVSNHHLFILSDLTYDDMYKSTTIANQIDTVKDWLKTNNVKFLKTTIDVVAYI